MSSWSSPPRPELTDPNPPSLFTLGGGGMLELALVAGAVGLAAIRLLWCTGVVALWLWELTGGIQGDGRLTAYGTSDWAWTVPVHLPVGLGAVGFPFVFIGSLVAGFAAAEFLLACRDRP